MLGHLLQAPGFATSSAYPSDCIQYSDWMTSTRLLYKQGKLA